MSVWKHASAVEEEAEDDAGMLVEDEQSKLLGKDSILFVIDCAPSMFERTLQLPEETTNTANNHLQTPFAAAIKCASATMQNKIISSEDDLVGVLFYNTASDRNASNFKHIYQWEQGMDVPDVKRIMQLEEIYKDPSGFLGQVGSVSVADAAPLGNVFWTCAAGIFGPLKRKVASKRIFLFTNNDSPHRDSINLQRAAKTRARDLADLGIFIELFSLPPPGERSFSLDSFYLDILPFGGINNEFDNDEDEQGETSSVSEKLSELLLRVRRRESRKRALARLSLTLGPGMEIGIRSYSLLIEAKRSGWVWMDAKSGQAVLPSTEWLDTRTGSSLAAPREELAFYFEFGGERAIFTSRTELAEAKQLFGPGLVMLGFKPKTFLKISYNITHSTFIFPDEGEVKGSTSAFSALLEALVEMDQIGIARYTPRSNLPPRLVALLPQIEEYDEDGVQGRPSGFHLIPLPYADDMRHLKFGEGMNPRVDLGLVDKAKEIVAKLILAGGYNPEAYENPVLQKHYASLQALALDQDVPEEIVDKTIPDLQLIHQRAGSLLEQFHDLLVPSGRKRKGSLEEESSPVQVNLYEQMNRLTVPLLKEFLQSVSIKPARLKADLLEQVKEYFEGLPVSSK